MSKKYCSNILTKCFPSLWCLNYKLNFLHKFIQFRKFYTDQIACAGENYKMQLLPDVEKLLKEGEMKHRKHPGIRKKEPIGIPEILKEAVYKRISLESEKALIEEGKDLCASLYSRRLPIETEEIRRRLNAMFPHFYGNLKELSEEISMKQMSVVKKRLSTEMKRWKPIEYNSRECLAYLVGRLAPNYGSTYYVLNELKMLMPEFKPERFFDFGSGVGSAVWVANTLWSDCIKEYFCIDTSPDMNDLSYSLITDEITEDKNIHPVFFRQFLPASETRKYDLVVSAFSLLELSTAADRLRVIDTLWRKTKDFLVVIEYGSAAGFHCVLDARDFILKVENDDSPDFAYYSSGAYVVSPCPHDFNCPKFSEKTNTSCGFSVPYQVLFPQRLSNTISKDWISYVILRKGKRPNDYSPFPRVVKHVSKKAKHAHCYLCCPDGKLHDIIVTRGKDRHAYRCAKVSKPGDTLPVNISVDNAEDEDTEDSNVK